MKQELLRNLRGYSSFCDECSFELCEKEYPGWTGKEKFIVFSKLTRSELESRYPEIVAHISPFILIDSSVSEALVDYKRHEYRHQWRERHNHSVFAFDDETELHHSIVDESFESELILKLILREALNHLTEAQKRRVILHYFEGLSYSQIAQQEGASVPVIFRSVNDALKKLRKFMDEG